MTINRQWPGSCLKMMLLYLFLGLLATVTCSPEQVHLAFYTSSWDISVSWITFEQGKGSRLLYKVVLSSADPILTYGTSGASMVNVTGTTNSWKFGEITRHSHVVILKDLKPSTQYCKCFPFATSTR